MNCNKYIISLVVYARHDAAQPQAEMSRFYLRNNLSLEDFVNLTKSSFTQDLKEAYWFKSKDEATRVKHWLSFNEPGFSAKDLEGETMDFVVGEILISK
jgi:hypothetical protein